jgi:ABC-2 type transport system permease protein
MSDLNLALRQVKFEARTFWRNPPAFFFTFAFPLMFLVIFDLLFGNEEITVEGGKANMLTFYVPAIVALSVISACFTNVAITVTYNRDQGLLKRVRGTPLPAWAFIFGRVVHSIFIAILLVVIVTVAGALFYGVEIPTKTLPAGILTVMVAAIAYSAQGLAITSVIPNAEASPAVVNGIILPLLFISDIFIPDTNAPEWLKALANFFSVKHFSEAMQTVFNPFVEGSGFEWVDIAVIAAWGAVGFFVATRTFSWEPRR